MRLPHNGGHPFHPTGQSGFQRTAPGRVSLLSDAALHQPAVLCGQERNYFTRSSLFSVWYNNMPCAVSCQVFFAVSHHFTKVPVLPSFFAEKEEKFLCANTPNILSFPNEIRKNHPPNSDDPFEIYVSQSNLADNLESLLVPLDNMK